jgi:hypothetical protein
MSLVNIQKYSEMPTSYAGMTALSGVKTPEARALDFPWDITSPEGIIAFFSAKLQETDAGLKKLMYSQEARNAAVKDIGLLNDLLSKYGDKPLMPGTPDFAEFQRLSGEISPAMGDTADENSVRGALDVNLKTGHVSQTFVAGDTAAIDAFKKAHPQATSQPVELGSVHWVALSADDAPSGVDPATCKDISTKLKTIADSYSQSNQTDMINIQNKVSQIGQISSLASNIVFKFNETAMGLIGNTK